MKEIRSFLLRHRLAAEQFCREELLDDFLAEMEMVRAGGSGTVKMIPAWINPPRRIREPVSVTAIDVGGTNVRAAIVTMDGQGICGIDRLPAFLTPGVNAAISAEEFFCRIVSGVGEHLNTDRIGICFSLAAVPQKDGDAVVVAGAKQIAVRDLLGKRVGQSFREAAAALDLPNRQRIIVINDTLAAALAGRSENSADSRNGTIGFIYGTGTNIAYPEPGGELVNIESGAYCGFPTGDLDDRYDASLPDAGQDRFEKMVSGGYQGGLMTCILHAAVEEQLLSRLFEEKLFPPGSPELTARDISAFSFREYGDSRIAAACRTDEERTVLRTIFDAVTARSARLCGITLTGALLRAGLGKTPGAPAFITAEGSTFLKQKGFRECLEAELTETAWKRFGISCVLRPVPDAVLKGTALAALQEESLSSE